MYDIQPDYNDTHVDVSGAITATQTSINLTGVGGISNGDIIKIGNEYMKVTAGGGTTTLTVIRGFSGTTEAAHNNGTKVELGVAPLTGGHSLKASGTDHNDDNSKRTASTLPPAWAAASARLLR